MIRGSLQTERHGALDRPGSGAPGQRADDTLRRDGCATEKQGHERHGQEERAERE